MELLKTENKNSNIKSIKKVKKTPIKNNVVNILPHKIKDMKLKR